jgi:hypothetical protein
MTENEALAHLRNVLAEKNPNLNRLVHATEQRFLAEAVARGRVYDGYIAGGLARTFVSLDVAAPRQTKRLSILARCNAHGSTGADQG